MSDTERPGPHSIRYTNPADRTTIRLVVPWGLMSGRIPPAVIEFPDVDDPHGIGHRFYYDGSDGDDGPAAVVIAHAPNTGTDTDVTP